MTQPSVELRKGRQCAVLGAGVAAVFAGKIHRQRRRNHHEKQQNQWQPHQKRK
jgi:hypothetical protein